MGQETPDGGKQRSSADYSVSDESRRTLWHDLWDKYSPIGQMVLDTDQTIRDCNPTAANLLGCDVEDLRGQLLSEFTSDDSSRVLELHLERTNDSRSPQTCELHFKRGESHTFDAVLHSTYVDADPERRYCLLAFFDMKEWKGAEPSKLLFEEQLRQSQRLEVLGRLAAGVTHDFNNLLTLITGYSRLLTDQLREDSRLRRHAEKISKAGSQATELVSQLLSFSRKSQLQSAVINVNEVIVDFESMLRQIVGEQISLEAILDPDIANIRVNPSQFDQVIMNLATNGRDAMPEGGTLTFETTDLHISNPSSYGLPDRASGRYVRLTVSDTGVGMSDEVMQHIFDPFYTTKDVGKGTGLGLATVFSVVSQYGGAIDVTSAPGDGTTFDLLFPSAEASVDRDRAPVGLAEQSSGFETVLLVDSNNDVRRFAATVLEDYGYRVVEVASSPAAMEVIEEEDISAVVCEMMKPAEKYEKFLNDLLAAAPDVKVVQVCSHPTDESKAAPDIAKLPKPFTPDQLAATLRRTLDDS
ncbi:MAG: ATP-binding protein [Myxococcota bacterium]